MAQRRMGRGAAVPPDGRVQMEVARAGVSAAEHTDADRCTGQRGAGDFSRRRLPRALKSNGREGNVNVELHQRPDRHAADPRALSRDRPRLRGRADQHPRLLPWHRRRAVRRPVHRRHRAEGADCRTDRPDRPDHVPLRHRHPVRAAVLRGPDRALAANTICSPSSRSWRAARRARSGRGLRRADSARHWASSPAR